MSRRAALARFGAVIVGDRPYDHTVDDAGTPRAPKILMLNTVKNIMQNLGDGTGDIAKRVGCATADLAKHVGGTTARVAKRVGGSTADLAQRIGPKRGLIGLAVLAAAVGGSIVLVRYLRARNAEQLDAEIAPEASQIPNPDRRKVSRAQRKNGHSTVAH